MNNIMRGLINLVEGVEELSAPLSQAQQSIIERAIKVIARRFKLKHDFYYGHCAVISCELFLKKLVPPGFHPYSVEVGEDEHVILYNTHSRQVIDPTGNQYSLPMFSWRDNVGVYKNFHKLTPQEIASAD